jgi:hypothetical protein
MRRLKRKRPKEKTPAPERPKTYPCMSCAKFYFHVPGIVCYWCRQGKQPPKPRRPLRRKRREEVNPWLEE